MRVTFLVRQCDRRILKLRDQQRDLIAECRQIAAAIEQFKGTLGGGDRGIVPSELPRRVPYLKLDDSLDDLVESEF